ncbi:MAG: hypothetical protein WAP49_00200 [Mycobacterium sp.]
MTPLSEVTLVLTTLLAEEPTMTGPDFGKASPVGLLIVVLLLIGVFVLIRSMNRHLRRVRENFGAADLETGDGPQTGEATGAGEPTREPGR